jgi:hypothetical protein
LTYVVNESCIRCKTMDCVAVCPVDCFYEGENMLVIHPDECIDCGGKMSEFVRLSLPLLPVGRGRFFDRNIWPDFRVFRIQRQPFLKPWSGISLNGIDGTFWFANGPLLRPVGSAELGSGTDTARAFSASITRAGIWRDHRLFKRLARRDRNITFVVGRS